MRYRKFLWVLLILAAVASGRQTPAMPELTLSTPNAISDIDKNHLRHARNKTLVLVRGVITHQDRAANLWAFVQDDTGTVLLDFSSEKLTPLPRNSIGKNILVEGRVSSDDTVLNGYAIIPAAYKLEI